MQHDYEKRLRIPACAHCDLALYSPEGLLLAKGYQRLVSGARGPYLEMLPENVIRAHFHVPEDQRYRLTSPTVYYVEFRSNCPSRVKAYLQRRLTDHNDYRIGRWYIAPADLCVTGGQRALEASRSHQLPLIPKPKL